MPSYGTDFLDLHVSTCNFVDNLLTLYRIINHGLVQLCMCRSIFFSFACIDLKFCKQPPDHCCIINHGLDLKLQGAQLYMRRSIFFSFAYINLKLLTQFPFCSGHNFAGLGMQFPH